MFLLEMDTYFMTKKNYEEMKNRQFTEVIIPLNESGGKNDPYSIPLVAVAFHYAPVLGCILETPTETRIVTPWGKVHQHMSKMVHNLQGSLLEKSGVYTYICTGNQKVARGVSHRVLLSVSLHVKFMIGMLEAEKRKWGGRRGGGRHATS